MFIDSFTVTPNQMKALERKTDKSGISYWQLMLNAGVNAAKEIIKIADSSQRNILFLAGNGNNGGDCLISAKYLRAQGFNVSVLLVMGMPRTELALKALDRAHRSYIRPVVCEDEKDFAEKIAPLRDKADIIVDGIFGTGFHGSLPEFIAKEFKENINPKKCLKIAYDIPSGGNGKDGSADKNTFLADYTLTFGFKKTGLLQYPLFGYCKEIRTIDIGFELADCALAKSDLSEFKEDGIFEHIEPGTLYIREREPDSNKAYFGGVLCITGSERMPGACAMSTLAALKSGVGTVTVATAKNNIPILASNIYEAMYLPLETDENGFIAFTEKNKELLLEKMQSSKINSVLIGCGIGVTDDTKQLVEWVIKNADSDLIIDADGINCIADRIDMLLESTKNTVILTPHPGEMARIVNTTTADIQQNRYKYAKEFAEKYPHTILVLKGAGTIVSYSGASSVYLAVDTKGNSGMSKGGSGDVLAGLIAGLCPANYCKPLLGSELAFHDTAKTAVYIHSLAADIAKDKYTTQSMLPTDIINSIPDAFSAVWSYARKQLINIL
jgi:NAD(P)H-hydrate epimerase